MASSIQADINFDFNAYSSPCADPIVQRIRPGPGLVGPSRSREPSAAVSAPGRSPVLRCCGILQPIPGTGVYEQIKPYLIKDVAEMDFHYWHAEESWKHPYFTHAQLTEDRDRVIQIHAKATYGFLPKLHRKLERLWAMIRKPELIVDLIEIRARRRRYFKRLRNSEWGYTLDQRRDGVALQVPTAAYDN